MLLYLRSFLFNVCFFIWTFWCVLTATLGFVFGQKLVIWAAHYWGLGTHFFLKILCGVTYEIRGQDCWKGEAALFASKHQSTLETCMIQVLAFNSAIILKKELIYIPVFGQVIQKSGVIPINRSKGKKVLPQLIAGAKKFLAAGRPVFIFPEGHRRPVDAETKLRPGIGLIYEETGVPVYPVVLNTGTVWGRRSFLKKPGKVIYHILPPIAPGLDKDDFLTTLTHTLEHHTQALQGLSKEKTSLSTK